MRFGRVPAVREKGRKEEGGDAPKRKKKKGKGMEEKGWKGLRMRLHPETTPERPS